MVGLRRSTRKRAPPKRIQQQPKSTLSKTKRRKNPTKSGAKIRDTIVLKTPSFTGESVSPGGGDDTIAPATGVRRSPRNHAPPRYAPEKRKRKEKAKTTAILPVGSVDLEVCVNNPIFFREASELTVSGSNRCRPTTTSWPQEPATHGFFQLISRYACLIPQSFNEPPN